MRKMVVTSVFFSISIIMFFINLFLIKYVQNSEYCYWFDNLSEKDFTNSICISVAIWIIFDIFYGVYALCIFIDYGMLYMLRRLVKVRVTLPILLTFIICLIIYLGIIKFLECVDYKTYKRVKKIRNQIGIIKNTIQNLKTNKKRISELNSSNNLNEEMIKEIDSNINLLNNLKAELVNSLNSVVLSSTLKDLKDVEVEQESFDEIQKSLDKFQAYRSLNDMSKDLKELVKKYD